jgi:hypothetical protein
MHDRLKHPDEQYDTQLNFRVRESVANYVPRLAKINGETRQELFDRLVGEEYERYLTENADQIIAENRQQIVVLEAEIDDIQAIVSGS